MLGLREQLSQVLGVSSFSTLASDVASRTEIPDTIDPDFVTCLVDQFLREFGFDKASETLRLESGAFSCSNPAGSSSSRLCSPSCCPFPSQNIILTCVPL